MRASYFGQLCEGALWPPAPFRIVGDWLLAGYQALETSRNSPVLAFLAYFYVLDAQFIPYATWERQSGPFRKPEFEMALSGYWLSSSAHRSRFCHAQLLFYLKLVFWAYSHKLLSGSSFAITTFGTGLPFAMISQCTSFFLI